MKQIGVDPATLRRATLAPPDDWDDRNGQRSIVCPNCGDSDSLWTVETQVVYCDVSGYDLENRVVAYAGTTDYESSDSKTVTDPTTGAILLWCKGCMQHSLLVPPKGGQGGA